MEFTNLDWPCGCLGTGKESQSIGGTCWPGLGGQMCCKWGMFRKTHEAGVVHTVYVLAQALGSVWSTQGLFFIGLYTGCAVWARSEDWGGCRQGEIASPG